MKIGMCGVRGLGSDFLKLFSLHPDVEAVPVADFGAPTDGRQPLDH